MSNKTFSRRAISSLALAAVVALGGLSTLSGPAHAKDISLLNVSYDPTREFYAEYNGAFAKFWKAKTGDTVTVKGSHGGSGKQARSVNDGLDAEGGTVARAYETEALAEKGLANTYERSMRFEENQRTMITLMRQLLTLADERFGKIKNEDNRLMFDDSTDLSTYESLRQRLEKEARIETQLAQARVQHEVVEGDQQHHRKRVQRLHLAGVLDQEARPPPHVVRHHHGLALQHPGRGLLVEQRPEGSP